MAAGNLRYVIEVDDKGSATVQKFDQAAGKSLDEVNKKVGGLGTAFEKVGKVALTVFGAIGLAAGGLSLAGAVESALHFEEAMTRVRTRAGGATEELGAKVKDLAGGLGSATELAEGLGKALQVNAGDNAGETFDFLKRSAEVAKATFTDLNQTIEIIDGALDSYGLSAKSAAEVSDLLAKGATLAEASFGDFGGAVQKLLPTAGQLGVSMKETIAALASASAQNFDVGRSAQALSAVFLSLSTNAGKLKQSGIDLSDTLSQKGLAGVLQELMDRTGGAEEKLAELGIPAKELKVLLPILNQGAKGFASTLQGLEGASGTVTAKLAIVQKSFSYVVDEIKNRFQVVLIEAGGQILTALLPALEQAAAAISDLAKSGKVQEWAKAIGEGAVKVGSALLAATKFVLEHREALILLATVAGTVWAANQVNAYATALVQAMTVSTGAVKANIGALLSFGGQLKGVAQLLAGEFAARLAAGAGSLSAFGGTLKQLPGLLLAVTGPFALIVGAIAAVGVALIYGIKKWDEYERAGITAQIELGKQTKDLAAVLSDMARNTGQSVADLGERFQSLADIQAAAAKGDQAAVDALARLKVAHEKAAAAADAQKKSEDALRQAGLVSQEEFNAQAAGLVKAWDDLRIKGVTTGPVVESVAQQVMKLAESGRASKVDIAALTPVLDRARAVVANLGATAALSAEQIASISQGAQRSFLMKVGVAIDERDKQELLAQAQGIATGLKAAGDKGGKAYNEALAAGLEDLQGIRKKLGVNELSPELQAFFEKAIQKGALYKKQMEELASSSVKFADATKELLKSIGLLPAKEFAEQGAILATALKQLEAAGVRSGPVYEELQKKLFEYGASAQATGRAVRSELVPAVEAARDALNPIAQAAKTSGAELDKMAQDLDRFARSGLPIGQAADEVLKSIDALKVAGRDLTAEQERLYDSARAAKFEEEVRKATQALIDQADAAERMRGGADSIRAFYEDAVKRGKDLYESVKANAGAIDQFLETLSAAAIEADPLYEELFDVRQAQKAQAEVDAYGRELKEKFAGTALTAAQGKVAEFNRQMEAHGRSFTLASAESRRWAKENFENVQAVLAQGGKVPEQNRKWADSYGQLTGEVLKSGDAVIDKLGEIANASAQAAASMVSSFDVANGSLLSLGQGLGKNLLGGIQSVLGSGGGWKDIKGLFSSQVKSLFSTPEANAAGKSWGMTGGQAIGAGLSTAVSVWGNKYMSTGQKIGASLGSGIGGYFAGPLGAAIGGWIGGLFQKPEWKKVAKDIGRDLGVTLSKEAAQAIVDMKKQLGVSRSVAELLALPEISKDAKLSTENVGKFAAQFGKLVQLAQSGKKGSQEALQAIGQSFGILIGKMEESGLTGTRAFGQMVAAAKTMKDQVPEIAEFLKKNIGEAAEGLSQLFQAVKLDGKDAGDTLKNLGAISADVFEAMKSLPGGARAAIESLGPGLDAMVEKAKQAGVALPEGIAGLIGQRDFFKQNKDLYDSIDALVKITEGLGKAGFISAQGFEAIEKQAVLSFDQLTAAGRGLPDALGDVAPILQQIINEAGRNGKTIDENTKKLIDQAAQLGLVKVAGTDAFAQMRQESNYLLGGIAAIFGKKGAFQQYLSETGAAAQQTFTGMQTSFGTAAAGMNTTWQATTSSLITTTRAGGGAMADALGKGLDAIRAKGVETSQAVATSVSNTTTALITGAEAETGRVLGKLGKWSEELADRLADLAERRRQAEGNGGGGGGGGGRQFAGGGYVFGETGTTHHGEYVLEREAVDAIGLGNLAYMNKAHRMPGNEVVHASVPAAAAGGGGAVFRPTINAVFQLEDGTRLPVRVVEWVQQAAADGRFRISPDNLEDRR